MIQALGIRQRIRHWLSTPNREAIFVFGLQKSGTSAIAGLLAAKTGKTVTIDTKYLWEPYQSQIINGQLSIASQVKRYSFPFSRDIIKEPASTFFIEELKTYFSLNKYVFIVRDPFDNIQSILNRLNLPGTKRSIELKEINPNWRYLFQKQEGRNYVGVLADRWLLANNQKAVIEASNCILVRYEDFNKNKENYIESLSNQLGLENKESIKAILDNPFQPRSVQKMTPLDFFGKENYDLIAAKCGDTARYLGYEF